MGKIITGLRELGRKMTGSEITSNRIGDAIKEIASKYTGGGGGGVLIVHATVDNDTETVTIDKTFSEIYNAIPNVEIHTVGEGTERYTLVNWAYNEEFNVGIAYFAYNYLDSYYVGQRGITVNKDNSVFYEDYSHEFSE